MLGVVCMAPLSSRGSAAVDTPWIRHISNSEDAFQMLRLDRCEPFSSAALGYKRSDRTQTLTRKNAFSHRIWVLDFVEEKHVWTLKARVSIN